jgi:hypothetical protein
MPKWIVTQVHGILMATAWGLIIPCGVLVSRYGKPWTHWFVTHRTVQVLSGPPRPIAARLDNTYCIMRANTASCT